MAFRTNKMPVLQEKSASGAVATFNTALAMPLASCNIAVNAWQEGSGDPSPSNVRPIHGFREVNLTANNVVHTKQLGETVYGGSYNIDGTKRKIYEKVVFDGSEDENWLSFGQYGFQIYLSTMKSGLRQYGLCNWLKVASSSEPSNTVILGSNSKYIYLNNLTRDILPEVTSAALFREYLAEHNLEITYPLVEPIESNIGATPISTNIGNNTIFADTGDVDLTFKDLDIAKRGNFREVFKLPS